MERFSDVFRNRVILCKDISAFSKTNSLWKISDPVVAFSESIRLNKILEKIKTKRKIVI